MKQKGQAIVIIALFMIGLIGIIGLAIDGGGVLLLYRDAQNAVDSAVMQSAHARCTSPEGTDNWIAVGIEAMSKNGFRTSTNVNAETEIVVTVKEWERNTSYVYIEVVAQKPSYFIQFVYNAPLEVRASAVAGCERAIVASNMPGAFSGAPAGTCSGNTSEFGWNGSSSTWIGDIHSNGDYSVGGSNGNPTEVVGNLTSSGESESSQYVLYDGDRDGFSDGDNPKENVDVVDFPEIVNLDYYNPNGDGRIYNAVPQANYVNGNWNMSDILPTFLDENGSVQTVIEGLYYVTGNVSVASGQAPIIGEDGITIVSESQIILGSTGSMAWDFKYYRPIREMPATDGLHYPAIVLATNYGTRSGCETSPAHAGISFTGNNNIEGIFYAPNTGVVMSFNQARFYGAVYSWTMVLSGGEAHFEFVPDMLVDRPPTIAQIQ